MSVKENRVRITGRPDEDRVTLIIEWRTNWSPAERRQITLPLSVFEQALRDAELLIPWQDGAR